MVGVMVTEPVIGLLDLELDSIGATRMGDPMSMDSMAPGVGIYITRRRGGEITGALARVGSASNGRGQSPIDGGYFVLYFRRVVTDSFGGDWASSPGPGNQLGTTESHGRFCAVRLTTG